MKKENILLGLKRASWLFALVSGLLTAIIITSDRHIYWEDPEEYLLHSIVACAIAFSVFRIGIWVFKAFADIEKNETNENQPNH